MRQIKKFYPIKVFQYSKVYSRNCIEVAVDVVCDGMTGRRVPSFLICLYSHLLQDRIFGTNFRRANLYALRGVCTDDGDEHFMATIS